MASKLKGIVLAGGEGTRLYPLNQIVCKQLLPVYDKPMIYYPVTTLLLAGIRDILIISTPRDLPTFKKILGDGSRIGVRFAYTEQPKPQGIAQALVIAEPFLDGSRSCLILGDNVFYGNLEFLREASRLKEGAMVFGYPVTDPERYGVIEFDAKGRALSLEEKPRKPKSRYVVPGLYFYDSQAPEWARTLKASARGEFEITDLNNLYLKRGKLRVHKLSRGIAWLDTGTPQSLLSASNFIETVETRQGFKFGCIEEASYRMGFIDLKKLKKSTESLPAGQYRNYLEAIIREEA